MDNGKRRTTVFIAVIAVIAFLLIAIVSLAGLADDPSATLNTLDMLQDIPAASDEAWADSAAGFAADSAIAIYQWENDGSVANAIIKISDSAAVATSPYSYITGASVDAIKGLDWDQASTPVQQYDPTNGIELTATSPAAIVRYEDTSATKYIAVLLTGVAFKSIAIEANPPAAHETVEVDEGQQVTFTATVTGTYGNNIDAHFNVPADQIAWGTVSGTTFTALAEASGSAYTTPQLSAATGSATYACQISTGAASAHASNSITVVLKNATSGATLEIQNTTMALDSENPIIRATVQNVEEGQTVTLTLQVTQNDAVAVEASVGTDSKVAFALTSDNIAALKQAMGAHEWLLCGVSATAAGTSTGSPIALTVNPASIVLTQAATSGMLSVSLRWPVLTLSLPNNATATLDGTVRGDTTDATYTWVSSDPDVASVSPYMSNNRPHATVTAHGKGSARITLTVTSGTATASVSCEVTVTPLEIEPSAESINPGAGFSLTALLNGTAAAPQTGTWSVSRVPEISGGDVTLGIVTAGTGQNNMTNPLVATVPVDARIGEYRVTYTPADTSIPPATATVWVVTPDWREVSISGPSSLQTGDTIQITVTSSAPGLVADVSATGLQFVRTEPVGVSDAGQVILLPEHTGSAVTYVYEVTGAAGTVASFSLTDVLLNNGVEDVSITVNPWRATISGSSEPVGPSETQPRPTMSPPVADEPTSGPSAGPTMEPTQNPVSPIPGSPIDFEIAENPTVGGDALEGIAIDTSTGTTPTIADLRTYSNLPAGSEMVVTTPDGASVAWDTPVSTGQIVTVRNEAGDIISQSTVVVKGDVLGTGHINLSQVVRLAAAFRGTDPLSGAFLAAGQWTDTGSTGISLSDMVNEAQIYNDAGRDPSRYTR